MFFYTERLLLRRWTENDAQSLYKYAKDESVGHAAGWKPHKSIEESLEIIKNVLSAEQCYAICEKDSDIAIGCIELRLNGNTDMTDSDTECELGYWLGKPYWNRGYMSEAGKKILKYAFETLGMTTVWCGYYDGNLKSKRVQEKLGFVFHHTCNDVPVPAFNEIRVRHTNILTRQMWLKMR